MSFKQLADKERELAANQPIKRIGAQPMIISICKFCILSLKLLIFAYPAYILGISFLAIALWGEL